MKRIILTLAVVISTIFAQAQSQNPNRVIVHKADKTMAGYAIDKVDSISFDVIGEVKANLNIVSTAENSAVVEINRTEDCKSFYLAYEPSADWDGYGTVADRVKEIKHTLLTVNGKQNLLSLKSGTQYNVYTLALDKYGIEGEAELKTMQVGTGNEDMFNVVLSGVTCNNIGLKITPKDQNMFYSWMLHTKEHYESCLAQSGDMNGFDRSWWEFVASQTGSSWLEAMRGDIVQGETDEPTSEWLYWDTDYVVTVYGISEEDGSPLTKTMVVPVKTLAPTPSSNVITVELGEIYKDGVDVKVTTNNNDQYIIGAERKEYVDYYTERGDFIKQYLGDVHENASLLHSGNENFKKTVVRADTDYFLIVVGFNGGPTTEVQLIPFHTKAM